MLNGRYDASFPAASSQLPLITLLATPDNDQRHMSYDAAHGCGWGEAGDGSDNGLFG